MKEQHRSPLKFTAMFTIVVNVIDPQNENRVLKVGIGDFMPPWTINMNIV